MLYGRRGERARIGELLRRARESRSGVLVLRGEPGVGKSALLEDARGQAADMLVLQGSGVESEARLPFAALHQLLRPVLHELGALPGPQASALRGALGLEEVGGDQRFLVSAAVLSLLDEVAGRRPVLCLVDDAHWLDEGSAGALVFVARRLEAEGIVLLFAARDAESRRFDAPGLPELRLAGLDDEAAGELLEASAGLALNAAARDRLIAGTGGNALALLELPSALNPEQLAGHEPLLGPLPVGARVEQAFLSRVERLPEDTRTLLLVAAADDEGDLATVLRAGAELGAPREALDPAEQAGLLRVRGRSLVLRHPLVRSAVYQSAPGSRRSAAHRALAAVLAGEESEDRRAWHLAAAAVEPDQAVVEALEAAAARARRRSAFAAASLAFERAASLSAETADRARQLGAAADNAWFAGELERSRILLDRVTPLSTDPLQRADLARWRGLIDLTSGAPADALRAFLPAAREVAPLDGGRALYLCNLASVAATYAADTAASIAIGELAGAVENGAGALHGVLRALPVGLGALAAGDHAGAAAHLRRALAWAAELDDQALLDEPATLILAGRAGLFLGDDEASHRLNGGAVARARATGALPLLAQALPRLAHVEHFAGRCPAAIASATEGLELARELGLEDVEAHDLGLLALIAAGAGQEERCRELAAAATGIAAAHAVSHVRDLASWALVRLELALGRPEEAFQQARGSRSGLFAYWSLLDRVEAAVRAGEPESARAWLEAVRPWAGAGGAAWARAVVLHCDALLCPDEGRAAVLCASALEVHAGSGRPFERARTSLALGELLRRSRRRIDARRHLRDALEAFDALGAAPWAAQAETELRASGRTARRRDPSTLEDLTPQELQIARRVAEGFTNREVAAQLFLSPRTIDFHLRNVFRKLHVATRTELAHVDLDALQAAVPADRPVRA